MAAYIVRDIDDDLWRRVKTKAAAEGVTAKDVILRLLAEWATARNKAS
jgi:plasmid stability protein